MLLNKGYVNMYMVYTIHYDLDYLTSVQTK